MAATTYLKNSSIKTPKPVYVVVGVGDLAVEKLRSVRLPRTDVKHVPAQAQAVVTGAVASADRLYGDLANRGKGLVTRILRQQATQDLEQQASNTAAAAKATGTTARKAAADTGSSAQQAAKSTRSRAKATSTSARKTADTAGTATKKAAEKVGDEHLGRR